MMETLATTHSTAEAYSIKLEEEEAPMSEADTIEDWTYFVSRLKDYVAATKITRKELVLNLLQCCDEILQRDLTGSADGSLDDESPDDVLETIRTHVVTEETSMVARFTLHNMSQHGEETVRSFGERLHHQAGLCKFIIQCDSCNQDVNYTDDIFCDILIHGLNDPEMQTEVLCHQNENMPLEEMLQFVEAKEAGKRSASKLFNTQRALAAGSSHRRSKKSAHGSLNKRDKHKACKFCGEKGHGESARVQDRKIHCSAYGHKCKRCNKKNHLESMCGRKDTKVKQEHEDGVMADGRDDEETDSVCEEQTAQSASGDSNMCDEEAPQASSAGSDGIEIKVEAEAPISNLDDPVPISSNTQQANKDVPAAPGSRNRKTNKTTTAAKPPCVCPVCGKTFHKKSNLTQHIKTHTGEKRTICHICGAKLSTKGHLKEHMIKHSGSKPYVCNVCGKSYFYRSSLSQHMSIHTGEKPYKCKLCDKAFRVLANLQVHMACMHSNERNYVCKVCNLAFKISTNLTKHMLIHTGVKRHVCKECGKAFNRANCLMKHMATHTTETPYVCNVCGKAFSRLSDGLNRHMKTHTNERPYVCNICGKAYRRLCDGLTKHMLTHTGEK